MNKPKLVVIGGVGLGLGLVAMGALPLATSMPAEPPAVTQAPPALENVYLPRVGRLVPRTQPDPKDDTWMIGCEVLDRDFAKFSAYKDYLPQLGIRSVRLQGGWAKCEKVKGQYDFAWLDEPVRRSPNRSGWISSRARSMPCRRSRPSRAPMA